MEIYYDKQRLYVTDLMTVLSVLHAAFMMGLLDSSPANMTERRPAYSEVLVVSLFI